jgi:hypothetical protein
MHAIQRCGRAKNLAILIALLLGSLLTRTAQAQNQAAAKFKIVIPSPGQEVEPGKRTSASGEHSLPAESHVWLFLIDNFGGFYLQNPAVEFTKDGQWEHNNVRPGRGIASLVAIQVNALGNERLLGWAKNNRWGKINRDEIKALPGYTELARVRITTPE